MPSASDDVSAIRDYFAEARWRASPGRAYLVRERHSLLRRALAEVQMPIQSARVCDVGCGAGSDLLMWREWGVPEDRLAGTELVIERVDAARGALPNADIRLVDGFALPFATDSFDVCSASLVLSTIQQPAARTHLLREMQRVTVPGGLVLLYDFTVRKPWNHRVVAISRRELTVSWRTPDLVFGAAPFLPLLDIVLRAPTAIARLLIEPLPRTHRMWVWHEPLAGQTEH